MPPEVYYEQIVESRPATERETKRQNDSAISRQIDELVRISKSERDKAFGADFFRECQDLYEVSDDPSTFPSFQPKVSIPQMQTLVLNEATDITDSSPKIYITQNDGRDKDREKYFQANWRSGFYNNRFLEAVVWAMYTNLGYLQLGFDPLARRGKGVTWMNARNPAMTYEDPYCTQASGPSWIVLEDWLYIDDVKRRWPDTGWAVKPRYISETEPGNLQDVSLEYPEKSPLAAQGSDMNTKIFRDNRVRVRTVYCFDNARERVQDYAGTRNIASNIVSMPRWQYRYPDGRWITECEGIVLADGNNWCPKLPDDERGTFPVTRLAAMPTLHNIWGVPPIRFTKSLQGLAERLYTQFFENCVRLNNGVIVMKSNTGLTASDVGWLPGEILIINPNSDKPEVISPQPFPQHMMQAPKILLDLQKELMGYGQARQGESGGGNVSADLFDATLWQQQAMTRLRGRLMSEPLQRLAQSVYYIEARYKNALDRRIDQSGNGNGFVEWRPTQNWQDADVELDQGSLKVLSAAALRSVVGALAKANMMPTETVLEAFGVPHAAEIAEEKTRELELSAAAKLKRPR